MPPFDHFGLLAPIYDRLIKPKAPELLWELADLPTNGLLLDAGGGTGRVAQFMVEKSGGVVIADPSIEMMQQAHNKADLLKICAASEGFPFLDESFSRIIMVDALHHVYNQPQTARELWRVLAPGGTMVIEEPDLRTLAIKLVAIAEKLALMRSHFLSPPNIAALFDDLPADVKIETDTNGFNAWVIVKKEN